MLKDIFTSDLADTGAHPSGWHRMKSGKWITRLPWWDFTFGIFARLGHGIGAKHLKSLGLRIATLAELQALHDEGLHIEPYTLPTAPMLKADGIANTEAAIQDYRTRHMMGLDWARLHDAVVFARLQSAGWDGATPVDNCGKHWAEGGLIFGWWKASGGMIQQPSPFHRADGTYVDYGTTIHAVSDTDPTGKDYGPARPPSGSVLGSVLGGVKSAAAEATRVLVALLGGGGGAPAVTSSKPVPVSSKQVPMAPDSPHASSFVQARNFRKGRLVKATLIVLHDMEAAESAKTAENVAAWFAGPAAPMASAHYNVDSDSIVQSVREADTAFHAPGANAQGIGIEMAGYAKQSAADWSDAFSVAMLDRASSLVADICERHGIPVQFVDSPGLLAGASGITTHAAVSKAWKKSTHTDPGPNFPIATFLESVRNKIAK
jgi:N-acetyl-anhydromuramyl-L-alanine amidase AmpD